MREEPELTRSKKKKRVLKPFVKDGIYILIFELIFMPIFAFIAIYYGPFRNTRELLITTAMATLNHQYIVTKFLPEDYIKMVIDKYETSLNLKQDKDEIVTNGNYDEGIELVSFKEKNYKGYILIVNDPSRIFVGSAPNIGVKGSTLSEIVKHYDAIGGINAGGFSDTGLMGTGGTPFGVVISKSKAENMPKSGSYQIVGFDKDDKLTISNSMSISRIKNEDLRDAVTFGPSLVVNGKINFSGSGGSGLNPRTAIGQRKDGTILLFVADGRQGDSLGATYYDVANKMLEYGAYNAANLDGGSSTTMVYKSELINSPSDMTGERHIPNAFIIKKAKGD